MKKRGINAIDVLIIITIIACAAGIVIRAVNLPSVLPDRSSEYRVSFSAEITEEQKEQVTSGIVFTDKNGTRFTLLEGYWIKYEDGKTTLNGELSAVGRLTESGFKCGENAYFKKDAVSLSSDKMSLRVQIVDFLENM